jgi:hypothetical protein
VVSGGGVEALLAVLAAVAPPPDGAAAAAPPPADDDDDKDSIMELAIGALANISIRNAHCTRVAAGGTAVKAATSVLRR